nr:hypothetical protein [Tanacetum cinerariifolium]
MKVVVVMFEETVTDVVKCSAESILELEDEPLANIIGTGHILELKSYTYYEHQNFESFTCWKIVVAEDVEETLNSPTVEPVIVGPDVFPKEPTLKRLVKSPSIATPSKPAQATKKDGRQPLIMLLYYFQFLTCSVWTQYIKEAIEDSDAGESFAIESRPTCRNAGCSSDMSKRRRLVADDSD